MNSTIKDWIERRTISLLDPLREFLPKRLYIAGGCYGKTVRDIDLFPADDHFQLEDKPEVKLVCQTKNAKTYKIKGTTVQMCHYRHDSLNDLLQSFDFAHTQIGAEAKIGTASVEVVWVQATENYIAARAIGDSWYTSSEYPLSSLVRLSKYHNRGEVSRGKLVQSMFSVLADLIDRGFVDYDDFKDQLDAVDLGLVPSEMAEMEANEMKRLFKSLTRCQ